LIDIGSIDRIVERFVWELGLLHRKGSPMAATEALTAELWLEFMQSRRAASSGACELYIKEHPRIPQLLLSPDFLRCPQVRITLTLLMTSFS